MNKQKRRKKQKKGEQEIKPGKHARIGNLNYYSEEIVKEIIDKIISLTITKIFTAKIDSKISDFCFDSMLRFLNLTLSLTNIKHDRDNIYDIENIYDKRKRLNSDEKRYRIINHIRCNRLRYKKAENDMLELAEVNRDFEAEMDLKKKNIDDFLNKSVEYESFNDNKKKPNANYWGNLTQPGSYGPQRLASKSNAMGKEILVLEKKEKPRSPNKEKVKAKPSFRKNLNYAGLFSIKPSSTSLKNYQNILNKSETMGVIEKKPRKITLMDMGDMKELEEKKVKIEETEEIKELRKLKLEELKLEKEEEEKLKHVRKLYSQNNLNFDYDLETINLTEREKSKNVQTQRKIIEEQIRKGNFTYDPNHNIILVRQIKPESLLDDFPLAITKPKEKENVINNFIPLNLPPEESNINDKTKKKIVVEEKNNLSSFYLFNSKEQPSGSNFERINPEVGVTVHEGDEIKSGGSEFFEKYKRFSLKDFKKILHEITLQENFNKTLERKREEENKKDMNNTTKKRKNITIENSKTKDGLSPLGQRVSNIKLNALKTKKSMVKSQSQIYTINKTNLYKNLFVYDEKEKKRNHRKSSMREIKEYTHRINQKNLFLKRFKHIRDMADNKSLQVIDSFNSSLVKNYDINYMKPFIRKKKDNNDSLPIIPQKNNRSDIFNKKIEMQRTRHKKSIDNYDN